MKEMVLTRPDMMPARGKDVSLGVVEGNVVVILGLTQTNLAKLKNVDTVGC